MTTKPVVPPRTRAPFEVPDLGELKSTIAAAGSSGVPS